MPPRPYLSLAIPSTETGDDYDTDDSVSEWSTGDPLWEKNNVKDREECFSPPAQMDTDSAPHHSPFDFPSVHPNPIDAACTALAKERAPGGGVGRDPGVAMCVVERGEVVHTFAAGVVRITAEDEGQGGTRAAASASGSAAPGVDAQARQEPREVDCDTMFLTASISKTVMAIACMQAVERGELDIDADLRDVARTRELQRLATVNWLRRILSQVTRRALAALQVCEDRFGDAVSFQGRDYAATLAAAGAGARQ